MMKRRNVIIAFLLVAVMLLGVGYAEITDQLVIKGSAKTDGSVIEDTFQEAMGFSAVKLLSATTGVTVKNGDVDLEANANATEFALVESVNFSVEGFDALNEEIQIQYTIKNASVDLDAKLTGVVVSNTSEYFDVTATQIDNNGVSVVAGGTYAVTVTVRVKKLPNGTADVTDSFTVTYTAEAVSKASN